MKRKLSIISIAAASVLVLTGVWLLDIPNWKTLDPNLLEHLQSASVVYDRHGNEAFPLYGAQKRRTVSIDELPEYVPLAFVAAEDKRFYEHGGIDLRRIAGAALNNLRSGTLGEGASTITQQLIKLTHLSSDKTFRRKIAEARLAIQAEHTYSKDQILEMYLNTIYFGNGAYGIDMAAETYFGKRAADLNIPEAATLAGIIKSPNSYSPRNSPEKALQRREYVLNEMLECGYIAPAEHTSACSEPLLLTKGSDEGVSSWYRDAVIREAAELLSTDTQSILGGGYRIDTALDMDMQRAADACMGDESAFPTGGTEGAFIAVDPSDGGVLAVCGGRSDDTRMALNRALDSRRQPGSVIKPISTYAAAIDAMNWLPSDTLDDTQRVFTGGYMPRNANDSYHGTVTLRTALSKSLNVATVSLAEQVGVASMRNYARRFGIPVENDDASLAFALGSMTYGVTPAEVAGAYAALANGGTTVDIHLITRITDRNGNILYEWNAPRQRAVSSATAAMITDMLCTAATDGSAHALRSAGIPVAAKTGTVSVEDGTRDIWTVAYTPDVCVSVWMGYDSSEEGVMPESASGSGYPAKLAAAWLAEVKDQLTCREFSIPDTLQKVALDKISLEEDHAVLLAGEHTPQSEQIIEIFPVSHVPTQISRRYETPRSVTTATLSTNGLGQPVIRFTAAQNGMEYLILRHQNGRIDCVTILSGEAGEQLQCTDEGASLLSEADYQIVTRQRSLYGKGTLLTEEDGTLLHFQPLMTRLTNPSEAPRTTTAPQPEKSLFGQ